MIILILRSKIKDKEHSKRFKIHTIQCILGGAHKQTGRLTLADPGPLVVSAHGSRSPKHTYFRQRDNLRYRKMNLANFLFFITPQPYKYRL